MSKFWPFGPVYGILPHVARINFGPHLARNCKKRPNRSACRLWILRTSVDLMWHKHFSCVMYSDEKTLAKYSVLQRFLRLRAQASFKCLIVVMTLFVSHQFSRTCVTTSIDSLGAKGVCVYSSVSEIQCTRSRPRWAPHIHIMVAPI